MATSIIPKSEFRRNENITYGYGEVPGTYLPDGSIGWGLPGGIITKDRSEACRIAIELDAILKANIKSPSELEKSKTYKGN